MTETDKVNENVKKGITKCNLAIIAVFLEFKVLTCY